MNLATLQANSGKLPAAADTLAEALVAEPEYESARRTLAEVLERLGEAGRARALRPRP